MKKVPETEKEQAEMRRMILETARAVRSGSATPGQAKEISQLAGAYVALRRVEIEAEREASTLDADPPAREVLTPAPAPPRAVTRGQPLASSGRRLVRLGGRPRGWPTRRAAHRG